MTPQDETEQQKYFCLCSLSPSQHRLLWPCARTPGEVPSHDRRDSSKHRVRLAVPQIASTLRRSLGASRVRIPFYPMAKPCLQDLLKEAACHSRFRESVHRFFDRNLQAHTAHRLRRRSKVLRRELFLWVCARLSSKDRGRKGRFRNRPPSHAPVGR